MTAVPPRPRTAPRIVAHRGASAAAPENTLAALRRAAAMGAAWVEVDLSLLGDGTVILHHDATLDRCTDANGLLADIGAADLSGIDAGSWFGAAFAGEPIATLDSALDLIDAIALSVNLELKPHGAPSAPLARATLDALAVRPGLTGRVTVSSFDHSALAALRMAGGEWPVALLYTALRDDWRQQAAALAVEAVHCRLRDTSPTDIAAANAAGLALRCYTVNETDGAAATLRAAGLDAVFTDVPDRFLADPDWAAWSLAESPP